MKMKLKIQTLKKEEYKKVYESYCKTIAGKEQISRLQRLLIIGTASILVSVYLFYDCIIEKSTWYEYFIPVALVVFGLVFIIGSIKLKRQSINNFYIKNKNSRK